VPLRDGNANTGFYQNNFIYIIEFSPHLPFATDELPDLSHGSMSYGN
jgi:hypothetical protein